MPGGILPPSCRAMLHDVQVRVRPGASDDDVSRGSDATTCGDATTGDGDDEVYDSCHDIRRRVARGNCFLELVDGIRPSLSCVVSAQN